MGRNKKKKREGEVKVVCFYCDRPFKDEDTLIEHQRAKHFKCEVCNRKLSTSKGLATHCYQVHRVELKGVPGAKDNHSSFDHDIYGMAGVQEALQILGELPDDEPDAKTAKLQEATAPAAAPPGVPQPPAAGAAPPGAFPGGVPPPPYGYQHPGYPYAPPPGYGYPPMGAPSAYGYPGWPPMPGAHPLGPPPAYPPGAPPPGMAAPHHSAPPRAPLFPLTSAPPTSAPPAADAALSHNQQQQQPPGGVPPRPDEASLSSPAAAVEPGLLWKDTEMSMEERRAALPRYRVAVKANGQQQHVGAS